MSLYGKTDTLAKAPKNEVSVATFSSANVDVDDNTIDLLGQTSFAIGDAVVYTAPTGGSAAGITGLTPTSTAYYVYPVDDGKITLHTSLADALEGNNAVNITNVGVDGTTTPHKLQRTGLRSVADGVTEEIVYVTYEESILADNKARGLKSPGWWKVRTYTDANSNLRYKAEHLVSLSKASSVVADAGDVGLTPGRTDDNWAAEKGYTITITDASVTIVDGATGTLEATIVTDPAGDEANLTYAWMVSDDAGATWAAASGGIYSNDTTDTLTITAPTTAADGNLYRLDVTGTGYAAKSSELVELTVTPVTIAISVQPANASVTAPSTAQFTVTAATTPSGRTLTYQWQIQESGTGAWANVTGGSGATTATYTTAATAVSAGAGPTNGDKYRVQISRLGATTVTSDGAATLTVGA